LAAAADDGPTGVMIVDDSAIFRSIIQRIVEAEPGFRVLGTARDGQIAVERCREWQPDIITLDVEMPNLSGLEALPRLLEARKGVSVIMVSSLTRRGAGETVQALMTGAVDYITKPSATAGAPDAALNELRESLLPKLRALKARGKRPSGAPTVMSASRKGAARARDAGPASPREAAALSPREGAPPSPRPPVSKGSGAPSRLPVVIGIGSSTGGPVALAELLAALPDNFSLPVVIAQHMPEVFTRLLAERLSDVSPFKVREAVAGEILRPGEVWIAPGNQHMTIEADAARKLRIALNSNAPVNSCRPSIDVLFESIARACGAESLGIVLTGMGHDGRNGARAIRDAGGQVLAQDEASSVVWGIPGAVVNAGLANGVHPLKELPLQILTRLRRASGSLRAAT
jgi:two-component system, chemotaxis family, protein-glutamate methylesterase/glutaminase